MTRAKPHSTPLLLKPTLNLNLLGAGVAVRIREAGNCSVAPPATKLVEDSKTAGKRRKDKVPDCFFL
jgi:hypothetical protein